MSTSTASLLLPVRQFERLSLTLIGFGVLLCTAGCEQSPEDKFDAKIDADRLTGMSLYRERRFKEAIPYFKSAVANPKLAGEASNLLTLLGECHTKVYEYKSAFKVLERAIELDPENLDAYLAKATAHRMLEQFKKAESCYIKAMDLKPESAELHAHLGAVTLFQKKYKLAVERLEKAIELNGSDAMAHANLAVAYANVGKFDLAETEFEKAKDQGFGQIDLVRQRIDKVKAKALGPQKK